MLLHSVSVCVVTCIKLGCIYSYKCFQNKNNYLAITSYAHSCIYNTCVIISTNIRSYVCSYVHVRIALYVGMHLLCLNNFGNNRSNTKLKNNIGSGNSRLNIQRRSMT